MEDRNDRVRHRQTTVYCCDCTGHKRGNTWPKDFCMTKKKSCIKARAGRIVCKKFENKH